VQPGGPIQYAIAALDFIFELPVFRSTDFIAQDNVPAPAARRILNVLRDDGVLRTLRPSRGRRAAIFMFDELLDIAEGSATE